MKILIITPYADPEKGACVVRVNGLCRHFTEQGEEVSIFAPARAGAKGAENVLRYSGIADLMRRIIAGKFDAIIGTSPPLTHNFFALLAAKACGAVFFLDAKDPFTDVMRKLQPDVAGSLKFRLFEMMESFTFRNCERVIFLNTPYLEEYTKKFSVPKDRAVLAPNGSDTKKIYFDAKARDVTRNELGLNDSFTFIYVGGVGDKDIAGFVREAFPAIVKNNHAKAVFILSFEGTAAQKRIIANMRSELEKQGVLGEAQFIFNVEFARLYKYLSAADCGLVAYPDFEMQVLGAKVFDYIAAGLPVAAKASAGNTELRHFIESNNLGFMETNWPAFMDKFKWFVGKGWIRNEIVKVARDNSRDKGCALVLREMRKAKGMVER
ncbi:MAG TPA: glycosyltransferase family 4 protein [Candidatus Diapherotrites archaeon]|uniref:Glycosyltransferase family 4 protein n=1 Tax=Candidatus Iainarchaeum sp. TaxID=3101447 RepID=A0A7J4IZ61_9ARCH|nr:glycosyltransferase family 4 protein [Candidatus Diapherotrites archaeon]